METAEGTEVEKSVSATSSATRVVDTLGPMIDTCSRRSSGAQASDADAASLCSSPASLRIRLRHTFLDIKDAPELTFGDVESPTSHQIASEPQQASPLRRSQSDVTGVDTYIRQRLGSNAGIDDDAVEFDGEAFSPAGRLSPVSSLAHVPGGSARGPPVVSILSFSPPTFQQSPFTDAKGVHADFVMVMEEDPPVVQQRHSSSNIRNEYPVSSSRHSTQPNTPVPSKYSDDLPHNEHVKDNERTTIMLRNIPNKYTQRMLLDEVNALGFQGEYDFFYLPIDYRNKCNVGYCFISFVTHDVAKSFIAKLSGYRLPGFNSQKICEVSWARVQGLKANIQHYRNSPVNSINVPEYRPLLFSNGAEIQFPFVNNRSH